MIGFKTYTNPVGFACAKTLFPNKVTFWFWVNMNLRWRRLLKPLYFPYLKEMNM
jgi:hypothetical protein